uniref:hypothetical protein n=1 Tax=Paenibacillus mendelii TaxID=206163 RepID=UPI001DC827BC
MKFKAQEKQNQLIEKITTKHLVVGIDIAQQTHVLSNRDSVVTRLVSAKNQIHRWVDVVFPELRQVFKGLMCTGSLATLRLFPTPDELRNLQPQEIIAGWKSLMKRHSGERKARALIALANNSVGSKQAAQAYKLHLKQLLDEYDLASRQLQTVETEIISVLDRIPFAKSMLAVKGISAISLAGILGEAGI